MKKKLLAGVFLTAIIMTGLILVNTVHFGTVRASTNVSGIIASDTTWTEANSPYYFMGPVGVAQGVKLTIEPGVTINLLTSYLQVNGTLIARGSSENPIYINNGGSGQLYNAITFTPLSTIWDEQTATGSIIENAIFNSSSLYISASPKINEDSFNNSNVWISNVCSNNGSYMYSNNLSPVISNSMFNGGGPYGIGTFYGGGLIANNTISGYSTGIEMHSDNRTTVEENLISGNGNGIQTIINQTTVSPIIQNNTITHNAIGISFTRQFPAPTSPTIIYNNIYANNNYNINSAVPDNINATYNWWGATNTSIINQTIYDFKNDFTLGTVNFVPFLTAPNPNAAPTQAPPIAFTTMTASNTFAGSTVNLTIGLTDTKGANITTCIFSWNNTGTWQNQTATALSQNFAALSGTWDNKASDTISVIAYAQDAAGNLGNSQQFNFTLNTPPPPTASVPIVNTNSVGSLEFTHQVIVRLPNGTLCATFSTNLFGINYCAVYVVSSNDNGSTWGTPTKISNATGMDSPLCNQGGCVIAADANNNLYVAWRGVNDGSTYFQVWCVRYNGSIWGTPTQVSQGSATGVQASYTSIAVDGNNTVHLVWQSFINGYNYQRIFYAKYNGTWSYPIAISTQPNNTFNEQMYPDIAVDSYNSLHVVWYGGSNSIYGQSEIWYAKYNGSWQTPVDISARSDLNSHIMNAPCLAVDSSNNLHAVWSGTCDSNPDFDQIWYTKYTTSWSTPIRISNATGMDSSSQTYPTISADSNNQIHVAWESARERALFYANYTGSWSTPVQLEPSNSSCPQFRWSFYPASNSITPNLDFVFLSGSVLTFDSGLRSCPSLSASMTPVSVQVVVGQSMAFTSTVVGGASPYTYQWYLNDAPVLGATLASWSFTPSTSGAYSVYLIVTDSTGRTAQSETGTIDVPANTQSLTGVFGYPFASLGAGSSGTQYTAYGSRFMLNVEANVTSMSCLMDYWIDTNHPNQNYSYSFAIYNDNDGFAGSLLAQTVQGAITIANSPNVPLWLTLNFTSVVPLAPGPYWLMEVDNSTGQVSKYNDVQNTYESVSSFIGNTFPASLPSPSYTFNYVYCIYASWEVYFPGSSPTPTPSPIVVPTLTPSPSSSTSPTPTPTPSSTLKSTKISISVNASSALVGAAVDINGRISDANGNPLQGVSVTLSYAILGSTLWVPIGSGTTNSAGDYDIQWVNTASGTFTLKVEWSGNADYLAASSSTTLSFLPYENQNVFLVESNSTVSALAFNSTSLELSFMVSGPSGTWGYVKATIAKSLISNGANIKVYLDGNKLNYALSSGANSWLLTFSYKHSTHQVVVSLGSAPPKPSTEIPFEMVTIAVVVAFVLGLAIAIAVKRRTKVSSR